MAATSRKSRALDHAALNSQQAALRLARLAQQALIAEAELTPKPGLVDRRGPGSHTDLSLDLMRQSAFALEPFFYEMASACQGTEPCQPLRESLGSIGRRAERSMLRATAGINTHRGAIWSLGLIVSAAALQGPESTAANTLTVTARKLACLSDNTLRTTSHGDAVAATYGVTGARGEARSGFPHVLHRGLPTLRERRASGLPESIARLDALLSISSTLSDTCILYRGDLSSLQAVQQLSTAVLQAGGTSTPEGLAHLHRLEAFVTERNLSPGGAADLLACTLLVDAIDRGADHIEPDQSGSEGGLHGTP